MYKTIPLKLILFRHLQSWISN